MKHQGKRYRKAHLKEKPALLSRFDKVIIIALPFLSLVLTVWFIVSSAQSRQKGSIDRLVKRWERSYGLTAEQARRLREIELEFHGDGNPFCPVVRRDVDEVRRHHLQMSQVMDQETASRFLAELRRPQQRH